MYIMGVMTKIDFKVINPKQGSNLYSSLIGRKWGWNMRANISLDNDLIDRKGKDKTIIIRCRGINVTNDELIFFEFKIRYFSNRSGLLDYRKRLDGN